VKSKNYDLAITYLKNTISDVFKYHRNIIDFEKLDEMDRKRWDKIENKKEDIYD